MYIYYVLRGMQNNQQVEREGDLNEELYPNVDLEDGPAVINHLVAHLRTEGIPGAWNECELTDSLFESEDNYIYFNGRWIRRSETPWRKDRSN
jgi:hypothetical protein